MPGMPGLVVRRRGEGAVGILLLPVRLPFKIGTVASGAVFGVESSRSIAGSFLAPAGPRISANPTPASATTGSAQITSFRIPSLSLRQPNRPSAMPIIQSAMPTIIRFSVSDTKPKGTLLSPPTQAHFNSRLSM